MKQIRVSFKMISATVLLALTVGCATSQTSTQSKESKQAGDQWG
jgi:ABC-type oligopeptide transport system substrate-binding subunit